MIYERSDGSYEGVPPGATVAHVTRREVTYGNYPGGDPREFRPDPEANDAKTLEAHAAACKAWDEAEANARRTSGSAFGSWPTPTKHDQHGARRPEQLQLRREANRLRGVSVSAGESNLNEKVLLSHWPTPTREDSESSGSRNYCDKRGSETLTSSARAAHWATPAARDWKSDRSRMADSELYGSKGRPLPRRALSAVSGETPISSSATIRTAGSGGQLTPEHSLWL